MSHCVKFNEITDTDVSEVGQKAAGLASLFNSGYPVPSGFIIKPSIFEDFLAQTGNRDRVQELVSGADLNDYQSISRISKQIREAMLSAEFPQVLEDEILEHYRKFNVSDDMQNLNDAAKSIMDAVRSDVYVIVRASPVDSREKTSFSGMHDSFHYVHGTAGIVKAIQKCMASFFSVQSIVYRLKNDIPHAGFMSIIIQEMIVAEKAGVTATANPVNGNRNQIVIEGSWGIGEAVTSGGVTPDRYIIDKETGNVVEKNISEKEWQYSVDPMNGGLQKDRVHETKKDERILGVNELKVIYSLSEKIHSHFRRPQRIEWAIYKNRVYILQSTALYVPSEASPHESQSLSIGGEKLHGFGNLNKTVTGVVTFVYNDGDFSKLSGGDVIVTGYALTDLSPVLLRASAIVTDEGGSLCDLAFIARELGIPMVAGTKNATQKIPEGIRATVNARDGTVFESRPQAPQHTQYGQGEPQFARMFNQNPLQSLQSQSTPMQQATGYPQHAQQVYPEPPQSISQPHEAHNSFFNQSSNGNNEVPVMQSQSFAGRDNNSASPASTFRQANTPSGFGSNSTGNHESYNQADVATRMKYELSVLDEINQIPGREDGAGLVDMSLFHTSSYEPQMQAENEQEYGAYNGNGHHAPEMGVIDPSAIAAVVERFYPRPVWFRVSRVDESQFINELNALNDVFSRGYGNMGLMVPSLNHPRQVQLVRNAAINCGIDMSKVRLGIFVDSTAPVFLADDFAKEGINFAFLDAGSIARHLLPGANSAIEASRHPAVLKAVEHAVSSFKSNRVETSINGAFAEDMELIERMVSAGIDSFTVRKEKLQATRLAAERAEKAKMLQIFKNRQQMHFGQ